MVRCAVCCAAVPARPRSGRPGKVSEGKSGRDGVGAPRRAAGHRSLPRVDGGLLRPLESGLLHPQVLGRF